MEVTTKIIKIGYDEAKIRCPNCNALITIYFKGKIVKDILSVSTTIVKDNQLKCGYCKSVFEVTRELKK